MSEISNIKSAHNIAPISGGGGGNQYSGQQNSNPKQENKHSKLRIGEVVRATVLERIDDEMAYVRIPTGTFKAYLGKNLIKDDALLFRVNETSPYLILKIYEVPTGKRDADFDTAEILRMLDIPNNEFYSNLVNIFREYRNSIVREDLLSI